MLPSSLEARLTTDSRAAVVTHLWGLPAEVQAISDIARRRGVVVVEDCAHALFAIHHGRQAGTWGDMGMFSFQASKHLSTGDGAMLTVNDDALLKEVQSIMNWGSAPDRLAYNFRMPGVVAAVGLAQLARARDYVDEDRGNAEYYDRVAAACPWLRTQAGPPYSVSSRHIWAATFHGEAHGVDFAEFKRACREEGAGIGFGYTQRTWREAQVVAAYQFPVFAEPVAYGRGCPTRCPHYTKDLPYATGYCPHAEDLVPRLCLRGLSHSAREDVERGAEGLGRAIARLS
jgi:perosamine synthetase